MRAGYGFAFAVLATLVSSAFVAACANSNGASPPDAEPLIPDAAIADAAILDAEIDAEPCFPDPDGETCNGNDDDCDDSVDEGFPGVGEC